MTVACDTADQIHLLAFSVYNITQYTAQDHLLGDVGETQNDIKEVFLDTQYTNVLFILADAT